MNNNIILQLAPNILKRMEYGINHFYLLNFNNNDIWVGNYAAYLCISKINGINTLEEIIKDVHKDIQNYSYDEIYKSIICIIEELLEKDFLIKK